MLAPFYAFYDINGDNQLDFEEFRMILSDVHEVLPKEQQKALFETTDADGNGFICFEEFVACMMNFTQLPEIKEPRRKFRRDPAYYLQLVDSDEEKMSQQSSKGSSKGRGGDDDDDDEGDDGDEDEDMPEDLADLEPEEQQRRIKWRAFLKMGAGSALVLIFSDPTVDVLGEIGTRMNISAFYVSFVLAPIASNATELVAAYNYAKKRTVKSMTTSLSSLLGAGVMNNTFCLGIFLGVIYFQKLAWQFTAETLAIVFVEICLGILSLRVSTLRMWHGFMVLSLYPLSLLLVWFLENIVGID